jgi:AcrR family transcriptional regulator
MVQEAIQRHEIIPRLAELFRERGFSGTSIADITQRTGLGKGSLYHFFPNGKKEMAEAVLENITDWFETNVFLPLRENKDPKHGINLMFQTVDEYFYSGERICLVGAFALDNTRDQFASKINTYFASWAKALSTALKYYGFNAREAATTAEDIIASIQGALVLARSQDDPKVFTRILKRLQKTYS